jgi:hypothetical protein
MSDKNMPDAEVGKMKFLQISVKKKVTPAEKVHCI